MLNQNEAKNRGISSPNPNIMYPLLHNATRHWSTRDKRWFLPHECLLLQGFPVRRHLANPRGLHRRLCSFCPYKEGQQPPLPLPQRLPDHVIGQAGNSQNLACASSVWLYVLMWIEIPVGWCPANSGSSIARLWGSRFAASSRMQPNV
jgi:hypothetical protein